MQLVVREDRAIHSGMSDQRTHRRRDEPTTNDRQTSGSGRHLTNPAPLDVDNASILAQRPNHHVRRSGGLHLGHLRLLPPATFLSHVRPGSPARSRRQRSASPAITRSGETRSARSSARDVQLAPKTVNPSSRRWCSRSSRDPGSCSARRTAPVLKTTLEPPQAPRQMAFVVSERVPTNTRSRQTPLHRRTASGSPRRMGAARRSGRP